MLNMMKKKNVGFAYEMPVFHIEPEPRLPDIDRQAKKKVKEMTDRKREHEPWNPDNYESFGEIIKSLDVFNTWKKDDDTKMTKKEIRESFDNLDQWVEDKAKEYQEEQRIKENKALM